MLLSLVSEPILGRNVTISRRQSYTRVKSCCGTLWYPQRKDVYFYQNGDKCVPGQEDINQTIRFAAFQRHSGRFLKRKWPEAQRRFPSDISPSEKRALCLR